MTKLNGWKMRCAVLLLCAATATASRAQTLTTIAEFDSSDGFPRGSLVQGRDGNLYGASGGNVYGTIFKVSPGGVLTLLHSFQYSEGSGPSSLALGADGNLYGTTAGGGPNHQGTAFSMTSAGTVTTLYSFGEPNGGFSNGSEPYGGLVQRGDGSLYGTTFDGGPNDCGGQHNCGVVFRITQTGAAMQRNFDFLDGANSLAGLTQGLDGKFYGTASAGGDPNCSIGGDEFYGCGTIFRVEPVGRPKAMHTFELGDGAVPLNALVSGGDGYFYGTTSEGGDLSCDPPYGCGTVFRISPSGALATLHKFHNGTDGAFPVGTLNQATDGNFYGVTGGSGGVPCNAYSGCGTLFRITPSGILTTLYIFCSQNDCADGSYAGGGLLQATDGMLYGTTTEGGNINCAAPLGCGTVYRPNIGLGPFVKLGRYSGKVGQTGGILGQGFTGTTSVSLNGTPAQFRVISDTFLKVMVPPGATTGYVTVTTPSGTLTSNVPFHVLK